MSRKNRVLKSLTLILVLFLMMMLPLTAVSAKSPKNYLALGDSIAYGLSANITADGDLNGYAYRYKNSLGNSLDYLNVAEPGYRTGDLLAYVNANTGTMPIQSTHVITISIGSNNLLGPTIAAIAALYQVVPPQPDPDGSLLIQALAAKIQVEILAGGNPMATLSQLLDSANPYGIAYSNALLAGAADFAAQWPAIIARIRSLNPTAEVYVNTIYNPLRVSGSSDPLYLLYLGMETLMASMNTMINTYALPYHYQVVDVYNGFKAFPATSSDVLTFSIPGALAALAAGNGALFAKCLDPHPTDFGHQKIFEWLRFVRDNTPNWYWRLPNPS